MATEWLQESRERESQEAAVAAAAAVMCVCVCVSVGEQLRCALEPSSVTDGNTGCKRAKREVETQETAAAAAAAVLGILKNKITAAQEEQMTVFKNCEVRRDKTRQDVTRST